MSLQRNIAAEYDFFNGLLGYFVPAWGTGHVLTTVSIGDHVFSLSAGQIVASVIIVFLTHLNARGLRAGSLVQNIFTFLKLGAITAFILFGLWVTRGSAAPTTGPPALGGASLLTGFGVALIAALWAFDGWSNLNFSAGEVKDPGRTLPRALILGTVAVTVIYLLTNAAYLRALSIPEMQGVTRVAERAATVLFGPGATAIIAASVLVSTFGATNGTILTGGCTTRWRKTVCSSIRWPACIRSTARLMLLYGFRGSGPACSVLLGPSTSCLHTPCLPHLSCTEPQRPRCSL